MSGLRDYIGCDYWIDGDARQGNRMKQTYAKTCNYILQTTVIYCICTEPPEWRWRGIHNIHAQIICTHACLHLGFKQRRLYN